MYGKKEPQKASHPAQTEAGWLERMLKSSVSRQTATSSLGVSRSVLLDATLGGASFLEQMGLREICRSATLIRHDTSISATSSIPESANWVTNSRSQVIYPNSNKELKSTTE